jgi:hypothetical protein
MNVPLYAVALIVSATLYLEFSVFLLIALAAALLGMAIVLAIQLARFRHGRATESVHRVADPDWIAARVKARRSSLRDSLITAVFIGITWGIFANIAPRNAQLMGRGWTYPSPAGGSDPLIEQTALLVVLVLLIALVGALWYLYGINSAESKIGRWRPPMIESVPPGDVVSCEFAEAYHFAVTDKAPPRMDAPALHSGDIRFFTLLSPSGQLPRRFPICRGHSAVFVQLEAWGRPLVARR